jgi:hypothetical protein
MFEISIALWKSLSPQPVLVQSMMTMSDARSPSEPGPASITYHQWKGLDKDFIKAKQKLFAGVFQNWIRGNASLEAFDKHGHTISESSSRRDEK